MEGGSVAAGGLPGVFVGHDHQDHAGEEAAEANLAIGGEHEVVDAVVAKGAEDLADLVDVDAARIRRDKWAHGAKVAHKRKYKEQI